MNNLTRFSDRVENYVKYRPHYPNEVLTYLVKELGFGHDWVVADIGSGTGISTELFLKNGNIVHAVEPNREMKKKAEELFKKYPNFLSRDGTAEETKLEKESIDLIVAGQAFHWFNRLLAKTEFVRIGRPLSYVVLMWNERMVRSDLEKKYEELILKYATDYTMVDHRNVTEKEIGNFFNPNAFRLKTFPNEQVSDFDGLKGRWFSSSYIPNEPGEKYDSMNLALRRLFDQHQHNGKVKFDYQTNLYVGKTR